MILRILGLAAALAMCSSAPSFAASACSEPIAPAAVDGGTATEVQIKAARDDVLTFIKQSDDYQACLYKELNDLKNAALKDKKELDPSIEAGVTAKVRANQGLKERVGGEFNAAVAAYKAKHPNG